MTNLFKPSMCKWISLPFLLLIISSCTKNVATDDTASPQIMSSARAGGTSLPVVSLKVTVHNSDASGNPYNIREDGKGDYVNDVDYVQAILDQSGTFAFNTFKTSLKSVVARRYVIYNFSNPVDPNNSYRPSPETTTNYHFSTGGSQYGTNPFIPLQNLGVNGNPASECMYMGNGISNSTKSWRVSFHKGVEDNATSPTAFAVATRTKVKAVDGVDEWVIQPVGGCSPNSNVAALRSGSGTIKDPEVLHGYYYLPFFFTLRAL